MNIQIRVLSAGAKKQLQDIEKQVNRTAAASGRGGGAVGALNRSMDPSKMAKWGNQLQWTGRQLQYNFTLPLLLAGGAATKFYMQNAEAFTRLQKVYGDMNMPQKQVRNETEALGRAFRKLSEIYGVHQNEVTEIGAAWAAAGASGVELARGVELTLKTMVLGQMEAGAATRTLIGIQAQYGYNTLGLAKIINTLNVVENQTGVSLNDLSEAMYRSAGVARAAGVGHKELAAMVAALVPAAGTAANAGNGLKTIISRLMNPTKDARQVLGMLGIELTSLEWKSSNASKRLEILAKRFTELDSQGKGTVSAQKLIAGAVLGSNWQLNRLITLLHSIEDENGYYQKAMKASADDTRNAAQAVKELNTVLNSAPGKMKVIGTVLQNSMIDIITPLIPTILYLAAAAAKLGQSFASLSPEMQKLIGVGLLAVLMVGPIVRYIGAVATLIAEFRNFGRLLATKVIPKMWNLITSMFSTPWKWFTTGVGAAYGKILLLGKGMGALFTRMTYMPIIGGMWVKLMNLFALGSGRITAIWGAMFARLNVLMIGPLNRIAAFFSTFLVGSFTASMNNLYGSLIGMWTTMWSRMVAVQAAATANLMMRLGVFFGALKARVIMGLGPALLAMNGMLIAAMGNISHIFWSTMTFFMRAWYMGTTKITAIWSVATATWTAITTAFAGWMATAHTALGSALVAIHGKFTGAILRVQVWFQTMFQAVWTATTARVTAIWAAFNTRILAIGVAMQTRLLALQAAFFGRLQALWLMATGRLRIIWTAFITFMTSPLRLLAGLQTLGALIMTWVMGLGKFLFTMGKLLPKLLFSGWGIVIMAALALIYGFRDQIVQIWANIKTAWNSQLGKFRILGLQIQFSGFTKFIHRMVDSITNAFWSLPKGIRDALLAVVKVVTSAARAVYEQFSWMNPFARHSPSLVESAQNGMAAVAAAYGSVGNAGSIFKQAVADIAAFKSAASGLNVGEFDDERADVKKAAPAALPAFDKLVSDLGPLNAALDAMAARVTAQEGVVARWEDALAAANAALDAQQTKLDDLKASADALQTAYDAHASALSGYADSPIAGMKKFSDQMFENEMAQKRLRLEMMNWEKANGSIDKIRDRIGLLQGDIETARGEVADLRGAGAGSDILGPIEDQIKAMEKERASLEDSVRNSPVNAMQSEMDRLQAEAERLDLENALKFDPLLRQIDDLTNKTKELTFDEIVAGINREQAAMDRLAPQIKAANDAVAAQEKVVTDATIARDAISARYDSEKTKLEALNKTYGEMESVVRDVEQALNDMGQSASAALEKARQNKPDALTPGAQNFKDAEGGYFADIGGDEKIGRVGKAGDQSADIDKWVAENAGKGVADSFGKLDMFKPIKDMWHKAWKWVEDNVMVYVNPVVNMVKFLTADMFKGIDMKSVMNTGFMKGLTDGFTTAIDVARTGFGWLVDLFNLFKPDLARVFDAFIFAAQELWRKVGPQVVGLIALIIPIFKALWKILQPIVAIIGGALLLAFKVIASVISNTIKPVFEVIINTLANFLRLVRGVIQVLVGIVNGDWKMVWEGIKNIFGAAWDQIVNVLSNIGPIIWGILKGIVTGIFDFFVWLWDVLVGHSIVPDIVNGIVEVFKWLVSIPKWIWDNVLNPIYKGFKSIWDNFLGPIVSTIFDGIVLEVKAILFIVKWIWDNVLNPLYGKFKTLWNDYLKGFVTGIKDGIVGTLKGIKDIVVWVWDNVLDPLYKKFKTIWNDYLKPFVTGIKDGVISIFKGMKDIVVWIWDNVLDPIYKKFKSIWDDYIKGLLNRELRGFANIWNWIGQAIAKGVNVGIDAINGLISALNWVGSHVPGLDFEVSTLGHVTWSNWTPPQLATGGIIPKNVGEGFATNQARAIVGEGGRHPEYVIPTDPRHRDNALKLYGDLTAKLGISPIGGWGWDVPGVDIAGAVKKTGSALRKGAVWAATKGPVAAANALINKMPDDPEVLRNMLKKARDNMVNWLKGVDGKVPKDTPAGNVGSDDLIGNSWAAIEKYLVDHANITRTITSTYRPGDRGYHGYHRAVDYSVAGHDNKGYGSMGLKNIFDALLPVAGNLKELILAGAPFNIKDGRKVAGYAWGTPGAPGNHWNHVHAALAKGAILNGPVHAMMGEAGREVVAPLTPLWARFDSLESKLESRLSTNGNGDTIINFYGDLSFPEIKSGDDAKTFIRNVGTLSRR